MAVKTDRLPLLVTFDHVTDGAKACPEVKGVSVVAYLKRLSVAKMDKQQRHRVLQALMWDYAISTSDIEDLIDGKIEKAGHYTREKLFVKLLSGLPWYTIIQIFPVGDVKEMLTDKVIGVLWPKSVQKQYEYVRKRLQEALPDYIEYEDVRLKIEFVNDIAYRCGIPNIYQYGLIDTPLNILTNKLSAIVGRDEPKDVFDIYTLAQHYKFNWLSVFGEAKNKAIINEIEVEQRIKSFPVLFFQKADWHIFPFDISDAGKAMQILANDFLLGSDNSLGRNQPPIEKAKVKT